MRVYYEDTDRGGVVYYANYLSYFERARTEWLRSLGVNQERLAAVEGIGFVVARAEIDFKAGARLDDMLEVTVEAGGEEEDLFLAGAGGAARGRHRCCAAARIQAACVRHRRHAAPADIRQHLCRRGSRHERNAGPGTLAR